MKLIRVTDETRAGIASLRASALPPMYMALVFLSIWTISLTPQDVVCSLSPVRACGFGDCDSSLSRARRLPDLRGCRAPEAGLALRGGSSAPALGESISEHLSMHLALLMNALVASNAAVTVYKAVSLAAERLTGFGPLSSCELIWGTRGEFDPWISSRVIAGIACCGAASVSTFLLAARMGFALLIHAAPLAAANAMASWGETFRVSCSIRLYCVLLSGVLLSGCVCCFAAGFSHSARAHSHSLVPYLLLLVQSLGSPPSSPTTRSRPSSVGETWAGARLAACAALSNSGLCG